MSSSTSGNASRHGPLPTVPDGLNAFLRRRLRDLRAGVPGMLGFALLIALVTYNPADPSLNVAADRPISNLLGRPGAVVADALLSWLGLAGFLVVPLLLAWAWRLRGEEGLPGRWWLRLLLVPPALVAVATALAFLPTPASWTLRGELGGALGLLSLRHATAALPGPDGVPAAGALVLGLAAGLYALALSPAQWAAIGRGLLWLGYGPGAWVVARLEQRAAGARRTAKPEGGARDQRKAKRREPRLTRTAAEAPGHEADEAASSPEKPPRAAKGADAAPATEVAPRATRPRPGKKARQDAQPELRFADGDADYAAPPLSLLTPTDPSTQNVVSRDALDKNARLLESVLSDFGVKGEIVKVRPGPVITRYDLEPAPGTKTSRVIGLADDIARSMSAVSVRVAVVPGSSEIGIELPNKQREVVLLRELLASQAYEAAKGRLPLILGKDIAGHPSIVDLAKMPHLLVAGTTGSGKSVAVNAMLLSLLYRLPPEQCRLILIDPKMLELSVYEGIPHLLSPVVIDPKKAVVALKWTVREMEERYRKMSRMGVRNIDGYNARIEEARRNGEVLTRKVQTGFDPDTGQPIHEEQPFDLEPLPTIVVVVDEMADLMLVAGKEIEMAVQRLAQMARAAGIHLIMATQRPSVDVITGTIKANFPTRISFHVTSKVDSRTILGETGAEQLLGQGDMLYMAHGGRIMRVHGPLVTDEEVEKVVAHLQSLGAPDYVEEVTSDDEESGGVQDLLPGGGDGGGGEGDLYEKAVAVVCQHKKASTSFVQRQLQIGYNRAARLIERMEAEGVVSQANHVGKREVLIESPGER